MKTMSHPSFLRNLSSMNKRERLKGFQIGRENRTKNGATVIPQAVSVPTGAGKAGQELLDTAYRFDGISSARGLALDHDEPLLRETTKRHRPAARSPTVSGDFPTTTSADSPWPVRIYHSENWFRSASGVCTKKRSPRPVLRSELAHW